MKPWKSVDEQIEHLRSKNFTITSEDEPKIRKFLSNVNYYRLMGYAFRFKTNNTSNNEADDFEGKSFLDIIELHEKDVCLRQELLHICEKTELKLRFLFAYFFGNIDANIHNDAKYWKSKNFRNWHQYVNRGMQKKLDLPIIHHNKNINAMPIWVIVEFITLGELINFFTGLKVKYQKDFLNSVSSNFTPDNFIITLHKIRVMRNTCAHCGRIGNDEIKFKLHENQPEINTTAKNFRVIGEKICLMSVPTTKV